MRDFYLYLFYINLLSFVLFAVGSTVTKDQR